MSDFTEWTLDEAQKAIAEDVEARLGSQDAFDESEAFVEEHDHWQDGGGWVGPNGGEDTETRTLVLAAVERQFTPRDAISEVLDRMANALLRQEPDVDFVPIQPVPETASDEEKAAVEVEVVELKAKISAWWDAKKFWWLIRSALVRSRWAGRGLIRTWIAPGHLVEREDDDGKVVAFLLPKATELSEALDMVQLSAPEPDAALVYTDEETQERIAIVLFEDDEGEVKAELWWLDDKDLAAVSIVSKGETAEQGDRETVDLGGRLPLIQMQANLLITEPIRRQQKRLNFAESLLVRVAETGGFPERYTLNAEPGGLWSTTPPADGPALKTTAEKGKTWYLHAAPRTLGAAITTDLVGVTMKSGEGETRATPGVVFKDPTDPEYAIKSARHAYRTILEQCKQGHIVDDGTAEASGIAYQQARADYEDDLNGVKSEVEALIRNTIEAALAWAAAMMGGTNYLEKYRISVAMKVRSGPISPDEREQNNADVKAGTLSAETSMAMNGVEDVDAELQKLRTSPESIVDLRSKQISAIVELAAEGVPLDLAAEIIGVTEPEILAKFKAAEEAKSEPKTQEQAQDDEVAAALLAGTAAAGAGGGA